ncbi:zinc finger protein-domain-containing protein [Chaetomidium leptoderma]|uniref:Zinc finger protein-domain-containing protein n=1 Tax=Chaetomidium leptoderma TaxID=669021 RepID=A0AAN6VST9_9PEZI|nr:zinc finger protein-domain-containing protein [Chaetomidium leptoderma]
MASGRRLNACLDLEHDMAADLEQLGLIDARSDTDSSRSSSDLNPITLELNRLLSFQAETPIKAHERDDGPFIKIGEGECGAVFAREGDSFAVKLPRTYEHAALWNDYVNHARIARLFDMWEFDEVKIPACHYFVPADEPRFFKQHPRLGEAVYQECNLPASALVTERILPLPKRVRTLLINKYCAKKMKDQARTDPANRDCLVRIYLGSTQGKTGQHLFSLRNFKMHLNQIMELQLDVRALARRVGMALALMHWAAKTDARGVEFVLGSSSKTISLAADPSELWSVRPLKYTGPASGRHDDLFRRVETTQLWVLDFNQVRSISVDKEGVAQAVEAAMINDPYIPKPLQESDDEREVWKAFVLSYLEAAEVILVGEDEDILGLPRLFIQGLIDVQKEEQRAAIS